MDWSPKASRAHRRSPRRSRPSLESMEGRALLSTMVPDYNGVTGTAGGALWHFQKDGGWISPGGIGVVEAVSTRDQFGGEELFARLGNNGVWAYSFATNKWHDTLAYADKLIPAANGINMIAGGSLWHYQDNGGLARLGGTGVTTVVDSHNSRGQEEIFVRLTDASVWSYTMATAQWKNTGGQADSMVAAADGIHALAGGSLWHYQDSNAWTNEGGVGLVSIVDSRNALGQDEVFARIGDSSVWTYTFATGQWKSTGGRLDNMIPNANGISGTNSGTLGYLWHYQDDGGWTNTGGIQVAGVVDTYDQFHQEEMYARFNDRTIRAYSFTTHTWTNNLGSFD